MQIFRLYKLCYFLGGNLPLRRVSLIAHQDQERIGVSVALYLVDPIIFDILEGLPEGQVEYQKYCMGICMIRSLLL